MPATTLVELLDQAAAAGSGGLRFIDRDEAETFTGWGEIRRRAALTAGWLATAGIQPGERIGLVFRTSLSFFDAFQGVLFAGGVPVPLYPPVRLGRLGEYHRRTASMLDAVDARLLVAEPGVARLLGETVTGCRNSVTLRILDRLPDSTETVRSLATPAPDDLALVQFSSGTTVDPKPVALSHRAILAQVEALNRHWRHFRGACGVSWLPLYHDMGLIGCIFPAQEAAAELTLIPPELFVSRPAIWLRTLSRYRGTVSPAPNFAYGLCLEKIGDEEMSGVDLSPWRVALNGAEAASATIMRRFNERFARWGLRPETLSPVYGLSEASLAVTFSDLDRPFASRRFDAEILATERLARPAARGATQRATRETTQETELVSVGRPLPGFEIEIRSADEPPSRGAPLPEAHVGRLWVRGPSLMEGYLGRPEASRAVLVDGWLDTGDEGFTLEGELYLTGRAKDVLILRGRNYAPEDVERAVDAVDGVRTGCTAAVSHRPPGAASESLVLFVESRLSAGSSRDSLGETCGKQVLASTGLMVDRVVVLAAGTLPRTSSGKIRRREALEQHLAGTLAAPRRVTWWRLLWAMARSRWALTRRSSE